MTLAAKFTHFFVPRVASKLVYSARNRISLISLLLFLLMITLKARIPPNLSSTAPTELKMIHGKVQSSPVDDTWFVPY